MVHAGVDGLSRMIVFAKCSDNNCAATVLESFLDGVSAFGSPMCMRFQESWNRHSMSTQGSMSPYQMVSVPFRLLISNKYF